MVRAQWMDISGGIWSRLTINRAQVGLRLIFSVISHHFDFHREERKVREEERKKNLGALSRLRGSKSETT